MYKLITILAAAIPFIIFLKTVVFGKSKVMREASSTLKRQIDYLVWGILFCRGRSRLLGRDSYFFHLEMSTVDVYPMRGRDPTLPRIRSNGEGISLEAELIKAAVVIALIVPRHQLCAAFSARVCDDNSLALGTAEVLFYDHVVQWTPPSGYRITL